jgi:hypothetical protein
MKNIHYPVQPRGFMAGTPIIDLVSSSDQLLILVSFINGTSHDKITPFTSDYRAECHYHTHQPSRLFGDANKTWDYLGPVGNAAIGFKRRDE